MCQRADMPNVSCADFITSLLLGWLDHRADAPMRQCTDMVISTVLVALMREHLTSGS